ncbi:LysM peptidoglycan-binding domain-containing protein, partial [Variovorax sp. OV700]|uniref:LysM peptidoglycan-binding domain-containing protein n=1 Tax=Variovorax sp. OV700 TaxID=1882826 RepID=UPI000885184F
TPLAQNGPLFSAQSDFSFGYQPIDGNYPAGSPGTYAVATGDTLQSIARGAYGDASLWYLIADANGLSSDADLRTGQVLRIPTRVGSADNAGTIKPYDPSKIASDSATMMAMPQSQDGGCGGIGQIIIIVVAIVVTIWTAGAAAGAWGAVGTAGTATASAGIGATMTTGLTALGGGYGALGVAAAVVGGAVGSAVSQAVGIGIGAQDQFSWKQVALSAIGSGVSAGLGIAGALPDTGSVLGNAALRGAVGNSLTQGIAVVTGLQDKFDWKSVAASAVGAGVGAAVGPTIGSAFESAFGSGAGSAFGARLATGLLAGAATAVMRGGKVSMQQVAVDAFGNALGDSIAAANGRGSSVRPFGETDAEAWGHVPAGAGYDYQGSGNGISNWQVNVAAQEAADGQWFDAQRDTTIERLQQEAGLPSSASYRTLRAGGMTVLPTEVQPHAPPRFSEASPYGPMTPIASGINEYGNPDYIWNSAGTRSDAIPDRFAEARSLGQLPPMASAPAISTAESQALAAALGGEFSLLSSDLDPAIASNMGNSWVTSSAGATAGVGVSLGKMAYGTARLVSNALYQGSDIATLGTLHDTPAIRQAWAENTALGNGIINAVSSPREATTNLVEGIANRYNSAMSITGNDFQRSYQLGELFNDIGQAGVGGIYGARGLARWGATELQGLGVADWNFVARDVPTWGPYRTQAGAIGIGLERIEGPVRAEAINGSSRTVPLGFEGEAQFLRAGGELDAALRASGINDATIGVRGSSVVGGSARKGTQFGPQSDVDFWVESAALTEGRPTSTAIEGMVNANRVMKAYPELRAWSQRWTDALGRKITPAGFQPGTVPLEPAIALRR